MKIAHIYSHFNGLEYIKVRKPELWKEIETVIADVAMESYRNADGVNAPQAQRRVCSKLKEQRWTRLGQYSRQQSAVQKGSNSDEFVKERVTINVRLCKSVIGCDIVSKHVTAYARDEIDVGIEILPMKSLQAHMSSGPGYYEGELYNVIRNGRGVPAVPLVMIGIAP